MKKYFKGGGSYGGSYLSLHSRVSAVPASSSFGEERIYDFFFLLFSSRRPARLRGGNDHIADTVPYPCSHFRLILTGTRLFHSSMAIQINDMLSSQLMSVSLLSL